VCTVGTASDIVTVTIPARFFTLLRDFLIDPLPAEANGLPHSSLKREPFTTWHGNNAKYGSASKHSHAADRACDVWARPSIAGVRYNTGIDDGGSRWNPARRSPVACGSDAFGGVRRAPRFGEVRAGTRRS
jgi:hypothetical protein